MLAELHIRDLALIDEVWLEFGPGLTVLSGETGAGKTVLLSALQLLMGQRADAGSVRYASDEALVEGRFLRTAPHEEELVVARRVSAAGRSRCALNGAMATVGQLEESVGPLVDLHGQHEHQSLLRTASHVGYLDALGGVEVASTHAEYLAALEAYREAVSRRDHLVEQLARSADEIAYNRTVLAEIDRVDPLPGEDEQLEAALPALQNAEALAAAADAARGALTGAGGAVDTVGEAIRALNKVSALAPEFGSLSEALASALAALDESAITLRTLADPARTDGAELDRVMARLTSLDGLKKRFGPTLDIVLERRAALAATASIIEGGDDALAEANRQVEHSLESLKAAAVALTVQRRRIADLFCVAVQDEMRGLALGTASVEVDIQPLPTDRWSASGPDVVEFLYSPAADVPARSLARIASGGEISRVMLALRSVLGAASPDQAETLVFDEVDAGIGGATATAVGERLAQLARSRQVVVVTHLAQVAAYADAHYVVRKVQAAGRTETVVVPVEGQERVAEVARMLSGTSDEVALEHARTLIASTRAQTTTHRDGQREDSL